MYTDIMKKAIEEVDKNKGNFPVRDLTMILWAIVSENGKMAK